MPLGATLCSSPGTSKSGWPTPSRNMQSMFAKIRCTVPGLGRQPAQFAVPTSTATSLCFVAIQICLELLALTPSGRDVPEFSNAVKEARSRLERITTQPIHKVIFNVSPWPPALCLCEALRVCMPKWRSRPPLFHQALLPTGLSFARWVLQNAPIAQPIALRKFDAIAVAHFSQALLANAGLHRNSPRSSSVAAGKLRARPGDPHERLTRMPPSGSRLGPAASESEQALRGRTVLLKKQSKLLWMNLAELGGPQASAQGCSKTIQVGAQRALCLGLGAQVAQLANPIGSHLEDKLLR